MIAASLMEEALARLNGGALTLDLTLRVIPTDAGLDLLQVTAGVTSGPLAGLCGQSEVIVDPALKSFTSIYGSSAAVVLEQALINVLEGVLAPPPKPIEETLT